MSKVVRTNLDGTEITKREILFSICIIIISLLIGIVITNKISDSILDRNEVYNKSIKIEDSDLFKYGMETNVGNAFVFGNLEAVDTVSYPEIDGQYMYAKKVKEKYTMHTRTVRYKVGKHYQTRTEHYWTWDYAGQDELTCKQIKFSDVVFDSVKFDIPSPDHIKTIKESSHIRYKYYGTPTKFEGTIFANLKDNTIPDNTNFYDDQTTEETYKMLVSNGSFYVGLFWVLWFPLTALVVYGFYRLENRWLE